MSDDPGGAGRGREGKRGAGLAALDLDRVIHERARLVVLAYLASADRAEVGFTELRDELGITAGNLSTQLKTLEDAGYVEIAKRFVENKPFTGLRLTTEGQEALAAYLSELEVIMESLRADIGKGGRKPGEE